MKKTVYPLSNYIGAYKEIREILQKPIDVSSLPIIGESKIFKPSGDKYGHVILKLSLETEPNFYGWLEIYSYTWEIDETEQFSNPVYTPIPKEYEHIIVREIEVFVTIMNFLNDSVPPLRFTLIGGSAMMTERPLFNRATVDAIVQIFKKLHE